jgi:hypothetical protein
MRIETLVDLDQAAETDMRRPDHPGAEHGEIHRVFQQ